MMSIVLCHDDGSPDLEGRDEGWDYGIVPALVFAQIEAG